VVKKRLYLLGEDATAATVARRLGWELVEGEPGAGDCVHLVGSRRWDVAVWTALLERGCRPVTLIDPSACVHDSVLLGDGCLLLPRAVVNVDTRIGANCVLGAGSSVDHDGLLGDHVRVDAGCHLAGTVRVGENAWLHTGVCVTPGKTIGAGCVVEAGSVVVRDLPPGCRAGGVPARVYSDGSGSSPPISTVR
jgi:sugar O-acyltransferase (sialic acid O-acetyltransferase NeuD family)